MYSLIGAALALLWLNISPSCAQQTITGTSNSDRQHATTSKSTLQTSIIQATRKQPGYSTMTSYHSASASPSGAYKHGMTTFTLSDGGLIAIVVIVAVVAIIGVGSTILFVVAKRRQWQVRESLKRVSRRLTGRSGTSNAQSSEDRSKRSGITSISKEAAVANPNRNKNALAIEIKDVERGSTEALPPGTAKAKGTLRWTQRLSRNDWR